LQVWLEHFTFSPRTWVKTLTVRTLLVALVTPVFILMPVLILRFDQGTLDIGKLLSDARGMWLALIAIFLVSLAEEAGWRAYLLPRLKTLPLYVTNLVVGVCWFLWQLPFVLAGRYNESDDFGSFLLAMFVYSILITPFLNRLAMRGDYNPILSAFLRTGLQFTVAVYFLQGRADPLTDTFGTLTLGWLLILNLVLFSQLWLGKKPPSEITELDRVMPDAYSA
jgi:hypothetical protein